MEKAVIKVEGLSKVYNLYDKPIDRLKEALNPFRGSYHRDHYALKNVSFEVEKGKTLGVIGKNGAGKSTLLKILTGVLEPSSGLHQANGRIAALLELGAGFNFELTGAGNIFFSGMLLGASKEEIREKYDQIVQFADIGSYIDQPVKTYSSGMFARLAFAIAIHVEPEVLIVDEALAVGDVFFQAKCNMYMKEKMEGVTKILVSHDLGAMAKMTDKVLLLEGGEVTYFGSPSKAIEIYTKQLHTESFSSGDQEEAEEKDDDYVGEHEHAIDLNWMPIPEGSMGGSMGVSFEKYAITVNGGEYTGIIREGDLVGVHAAYTSKADLDNVIFGYLIKDKHGLAIFGENTHTSDFDDKPARISVGAGDKGEVSILFKWPEIHEGEYFLVLGVGAGEDALQHEIQCWAHNIFLFRNVTIGKDVHGLFNNPITGFCKKSYRKG